MLREKLQEITTELKSNREGYVGGGLVSKTTRILLKKFKKNSEVKKFDKKVKEKVEAIEKKDLSGEAAEKEMAPLNKEAEELKKKLDAELMEGYDRMSEYLTSDSFTEKQTAKIPFYVEGPRTKQAEGGELDAQMSGIMEEEIPTHTMPDGTEMPGTVHEEGIEDTQVPDEEMEADYTDFVISEALQPEEQDYLMNALSQDDELSIIVDKVIETASEFSGAGQVDGPGTPVSDSIPARLSDGEFVMTAKATDAIGSDTLQELMNLAEQEAPPDRQANAIGGIAKQEAKVDIPSVIVEGEDPVSIKQREKMLALDPRLSLFAS
tara:strand:+ start:483 stop:1448 length:966 start_codon:yes stop_codon:yes gene_type:complete